MATQSVTLGGVLLAPLLPIETTEERIGAEQERLDGSRVFYHRAYKQSWTLRHDNADEALRTTWRNRWRTVGTQTYTNENRESYTVYVAAFRQQLNRMEGANAYYELEMELREV